MRRFALLLLVLGLAGGAYLAVLRLRQTTQGAQPASSAAVAASRVISDDGCGPGNAIVLSVPDATVGQPTDAAVGRMNACGNNEIERISGAVDWGDGISSAVDPGDFKGKDEGKLLTQPHTYAKAGTYQLFARVRAQCLEHGQSTRTIVCGSGTVHIR